MLSLFRSIIGLSAAGVLVFSASAVAGIESITPDECITMQNNGVMAPGSPVSCERLRRVMFEYVDFEGKTATGNVVVLDAVAEQVEAVFSTLFAQGYPIKKAVLMEQYKGDDNASMNDNNTSAFNGRPITGGTLWSKHAYGVAIDINPLQNPYISIKEDGRAQVLPSAGARSFVNRNDVRPGKSKREGLVEGVVEVFAQHGFMVWGGNWDFPVDYQHFEIGSRGFINKLLAQSPEDARQTFNRYAQSYRDCVDQSAEPEALKRRAVCVESVGK